MKGVVHILTNDKEKGVACMKEASRTTAVVAASVATGGTGFAAAAAAGVTAGLLADLTTTGIDSTVHNEYRPNGVLVLVKKAAKSGKAGEYFDLMATPIMDSL
ncbi:unnamed protein product, partial [Choristocarpus tenellus]